MTTLTGALAPPNLKKLKSIVARPASPLRLLVYLALAALVALAVVQVVAIDRQGERTDARRDAVAVAQRSVTALTTVSAKSLDDDISRMMKDATPGFRSQFEKQAKAFREGVQQGKVSSKGSVTAAGVSSITERKAVVMVAADGTVSNAVSSGPQQRSYRLRVTLKRSGDHWLVSGMEFVA